MLSFKQYLINEATSDCCDAPISGEPWKGHGRCSSCGEMSPLRKDEPEKKDKFNPKYIVKKNTKEATQPTVSNNPDTPKFTDKDIKVMKTLQKIEPYKSKAKNFQLKAMPKKKATKVQPIDLSVTF